MVELPEEVIEKATRLTKLARKAVDPEETAAYREHRAEVLSAYGFTVRVRAEAAAETLVFHPEEWVEDGTIRPERVETIERAVELQISGPENPDSWESLEKHNRKVAAQVHEEHGETHGDNADAFADFMGNHYAKSVADATPDERAEFLDEYFIRNAWPSEAQKEVIERSLEHVKKAAQTDS